MNDNQSRRRFLQSAAVVVIGGIPCMVLGRVVPNAGQTTDMLTYVINIKDYPQLNVVGGSVKLMAEEQMKFNPDHLVNRDVLKTAPRGRYPIAITRVAETGDEMFIAVSTFCTHGAGYQLNDYDPSTEEFVCPHRGSAFKVDGTPITREGAPSMNEPLRRFQLSYDLDLGIITLTRPK